MPRILVRTPSPAVRIDILQSSASEDQSLMTARTLRSQRDVLIVEADEEERKRIVGMGGVVFEDVQFETFPVASGREPPSAVPAPAALSLADVVRQINAPTAWRTTRGANTTIAIIDTGVSTALKEIPPSRRSPCDLPTAFHGQHWSDSVGHGSMCAAIAAGSTDAGGRFEGVAPEATVLSVRSDLTSADLTIAFDELVRARAGGMVRGPLIVSNSYGLNCCHDPGILPSDHPFLTGIVAAVEAGIFVCFAAGNNHHDTCGFDPRACAPNTIWGANSHDRVVSVGTVNRDLSNQDPTTPHVNSSRGPGEWATKTRKPDCVAPTYGEVPWGSGYKSLPWWGTSGACPQVAGAAALILAAAPSLDPDAISDIIRASCRPLRGSRTCIGHGLLDCGDAVGRVAAATA